MSFKKSQFWEKSKFWSNIFGVKTGNSVLFLTVLSVYQKSQDPNYYFGGKKCRRTCKQQVDAYNTNLPSNMPKLRPRCWTRRKTDCQAYSRTMCPAECTSNKYVSTSWPDGYRRRCTTDSYSQSFQIYYTPLIGVHRNCPEFFFVYIFFRPCVNGCARA